MINEVAIRKALAAEIADCIDNPGLSQHGRRMALVTVCHIIWPQCPINPAELLAWLRATPPEEMTR